MIDARDFQTYIISPGAKDTKAIIRDENIEQTLKCSGFKQRKFVDGAYLPNDPVVGCALSHAIAIQEALTIGAHQWFDPFIILENDATTESDTFELPDALHAWDALYIGISSGGNAINALERKHTWGGNFYSSTSYPNIVRIYNMLTTHAVLINTERFAQNWLNCAIEASAKNVPIDCLIAQTMPYYNVYAMQDPMFYQDGAVGGQEEFTNLYFEGIEIEPTVGALPWKLNSFQHPCISADLAKIQWENSLETGTR